MPAFTRSELADLNVFMTIVRRRSFRHSAQELGVSTSALSHSMRNLEARLGMKLLNRTSRSVVPTDAGSALAAKLEDGFQVIGEALGELDAYRTSPVGRLRLNVPRDASRLLLGPVLRRFTEAYPDLQLELSVEDRMVDIVADGYDAGIRYGGTVPQDMVAVPLTGELRWVVAASPDYLARHGVPQRPDDLLRHACIRMRLGDNSFYKWELGDGERMVEVDVPGPFSVNESNTAVAAALDGVGLAYCLEVGIAEELRSGRLQLVLPDWTSMGAPFCLYYPSRRQPQPGLRQLMEMIRGDWLGRA
ncbi:LysR family transcriptional regulator [Pseudomonas aeruginosa]|uniref:LysR family transcriptional regulator n=1 Tax=Pseudomonas aeruginosa TaxID=287 RepID=UPI0009376E3C|nr:LysR family transcriptional regulator [Pseudomonas aeruginosa]RUC68141.1 LysR family transcriptional regulator [Pseudomonas aeruginosa]HBO4963194.1 LysR family transcriptional regulator [Pseudomonas aeruginosa]HBO4968467.1 LysR family transcriptional regulator [Pseudomonas aeruginosa]HCF6387308.1 LysR family transcriptional regulator [Pseudomonas aeruginosa]HCF6390995.1 LysR family transcriptional regulator [Pseudomonas aeruginosa]